MGEGEGGEGGGGGGGGGNMIMWVPILPYHVYGLSLPRISLTSGVKLVGWVWKIEIEGIGDIKGNFSSSNT